MGLGQIALYPVSRINFLTKPNLMKNTILIVVLLMLFAFSPSFAQKHYSGSHHTKSHGGHYSSGSGSSHKGGHYKNSNTGNHYGKHKY